MKTKRIIQVARQLAKPFRITKGKHFCLKDVDPNDTLAFSTKNKPRAKEALANGIVALAELQDKLYAQDQWAVLLIFQAMDAAGKDGAIAHVMLGVNPQGCQVFSFKAPSAEDLDHDYLWRCDPQKNWKFSSNDPAERDYWDDYMAAYQEMIQQTATKHSLVRGACRQQMVYPRHRLRRGDRYAGRSGPDLSQNRRKQIEGTRHCQNQTAQELTDVSLGKKA